MLRGRYARRSGMVMKKAFAPARPIATTVGVAAVTKTLMLIGTQTTVITAITSAGPTTITISVRVSDAVMRMVTTAAINTAALIMEIIRSWIIFCPKSSASRIFAKDWENVSRNKRLGAQEKLESCEHSALENHD